ncbi:MAG: YqjK-like family protein [Zoogloeaceae bacterium]|jgi:hypothetical protein|nr:YqjK-like family protein [Zoogloeaceae bacterium]
MHPRLPSLFEERGFIRARIAAQRKMLVGQGEVVGRLCAVGDAVYTVTRWVRAHWLDLGLVSCAAVLILRPKHFPYLFRWGRRAFGLWRIGKKLFSRFVILRFFPG